MTELWLFVAAAVGSLLLGLLATPVASRVALRAGFVDHPGGHKSHLDPTPYGGGCAVFAAIVVPLVAALAAAWLVPLDWIGEHWGGLLRDYAGGLRDRSRQGGFMVAGALALHVLGLIDDRKPLGATPKLVAIALVALLTAGFGHVRIAEFAGPAFSIVVTTLWIIIVTNTFNFLDNMDGLSAGVACVCAIFLVICGVMAGQVFVPALGCIVLGAALGFLAFNFPPARIFMGDAGSLVLGYFLAVLSILTTYYESGATAPPYPLAMPLVILAVPLYDFMSVVSIRLLEGRNPLRGDQRHFSHRLVDRGLSRRNAVLTIYLVTAVTGLCATLLPGATARETLTIGFIVFMVLTIIAILEMPPRKAR